MFISFLTSAKFLHDWICTREVPSGDMGESPGEVIDISSRHRSFNSMFTPIRTSLLSIQSELARHTSANQLLLELLSSGRTDLRCYRWPSSEFSSPTYAVTASHGPVLLSLCSDALLLQKMARALKQLEPRREIWLPSPASYQSRKENHPVLSAWSYSLSTKKLETPSFKIVRCQTAQLAWVTEWASRFLEEKGQSISQVKRQMQLAVAAGEFYMLIDGEPRTMLRIKNVGQWMMRGSWFYTPPESRRHGYARHLLSGVANILNLTKDERLEFLVEEPNPSLNSFYKSVGCAPTTTFLRWSPNILQNFEMLELH